MSRLEISLLGPLDVRVDGDCVTDFETDTTRALLAYLAGESDRAHPRPVVAEMLWPDRPEGAALSNLRHSLSVLRRALRDRDRGSPALRTDRSTVMLDTSDDVFVDLNEFEALCDTAPGAIDAVERWERADGLWRGDLLEDLTLRASAGWDQWLITSRERVRRQLATILGRLADEYERASSWQRAVQTAQRLVDVDPWEEDGHRRLMRLLARTGQGSKAIAHFEQMKAMLSDELELEPDRATVALADQIRAGDLASERSEPELTAPTFLAELPRVESPVFVGRRALLEKLEQHLETALAGRGQIVFLAGEAGSGKSMLAAECMRRAMDRPGVLTARGRCSAFGAMGDPYLPFREVLGLLSGDVEPAYSAGALDRVQAMRLWEASPHTAQLISSHGPDVVGVMIDGSQLIDRISRAVPGAEWLGGFRARIEGLAERISAEREQGAVFDGFASVLQRLSLFRPLVLVIDDLQWADRGSLAVLWHLARRIEDMRVLIIGAFRPEDVGSDIPARPPGLAELIELIRVRSPDSMIEVVGDRDFVDEFLDSEPNDFDSEFRDRLYSYTGGHALFTVELVRGMQDRGEIRRTSTGVWSLRPNLDWEQLPSRVEAVIAHRVARLIPELRDDLTVSSVQGDDFIAEVTAAVRDDPATPVRLSRESSSVARLTEPTGVERVDGRLIGRRRFRHVLFQRFLYERIEEVERARLHEATARALEDLFYGRPDMPLVDLARHFEAAGLIESSVDYFARAGQRAMEMVGLEEAAGLFGRALDLLASLPESPPRDRRELELLVALSAPATVLRGYADPETERIGLRARALCGRLEPSPIVASALLGLAATYGVRGRYEAVEELCQEGLELAEELGDSGLMLVGNQTLGVARIFMGDLHGAGLSLERAMRVYDPEAHDWVKHAFGSAMGPEAMAWRAVETLLRGDRDAARCLGEDAIARASDTGHAFTICHTIAAGGVLVRLMDKEYEAALPFIEQVARIAETEHFAFYQGAATLYRAAVEGHLDDPDAGIAAITAGLESWRRAGVESYRGQFLAIVGDLEIRAGRPERGVVVTERGLVEVEASGESLTGVVLRIEQGRAFAALGDVDAASACLELARSTAQLMGAHLLWTRAGAELAALTERAGDTPTIPLDPHAHAE